MSLIKYTNKKAFLNGAFPQPFVWRNDISIAQGKKGHSHYFNDQNIHLFPERFAFIACKYLYFICFVQNKWKIPEGINEYYYIRKLLHFNGNAYFCIHLITLLSILLKPRIENIKLECKNYKYNYKLYFRLRFDLVSWIKIKSRLKIVLCEGILPLNAYWLNSPYQIRALFIYHKSLKSAFEPFFSRYNKPLEFVCACC